MDSGLMFGLLQWKIVVRCYKMYIRLLLIDLVMSLRQVGEA